MEYDLSTLKRIAQGGQADIYALEEDRILRVLRYQNPWDFDLMQQEGAVMTALRQQGVGVPEIFGYGVADGYPALAMQRVRGPSLLQKLQRNPLLLGKTAELLAREHCAVLAVPPIQGLPDIISRERTQALQSKLLEEDDISFVNRLLDELPVGPALLHGDFHPGNILTQGDDLYIIDWFGVTSGDAVSDVAHTYLLLADKPRIPSESLLAHRLGCTMTLQFARRYLAAMRESMGFDLNIFAKWMVVRASGRTVHGQPNERQTKARFVKACRQATAKGIPPCQWIPLLGKGAV